MMRKVLLASLPREGHQVSRARTQMVPQPGVPPGATAPEMQQTPKPAGYPSMNMETAAAGKSAASPATAQHISSHQAGRGRFPEDLEDPFNRPAGHDKVFGDQRGFNIQWVLLIFWQLVIPCIVACFLPLCQHPHFPTRSYYRGWVANMVMACVMVALYIIIIAAACASSNTYYRRYYGYGY